MFVRRTFVRRAVTGIGRTMRLVVAVMVRLVLLMSRRIGDLRYPIRLVSEFFGQKRAVARRDGRLEGLGRLRLFENGR
ncbi:hypothetical protein ASG75_01265 [Rhodanobacter sp. Soil772]|nr:hypothetical protein ASG75_01265 [Rhodanobacter sp. Soil772]